MHKRKMASHFWPDKTLGQILLIIIIIIIITIIIIHNNNNNKNAQSMGAIANPQAYVLTPTLSPNPWGMTQATE